MSDVYSHFQESWGELCVQWLYRFKLRAGHAALAVHPPTLSTPQSLPPSIPNQAVDGNSFTIIQLNANGFGNKLVELGELERYNVKVVVIKALLKDSTFTTVRKDRRQAP